MTADSASYLAVGAALFVLGGIGFATRRNLILIFLSAELMLHGVSLTLLTFGRIHQNLEGQAFTIFILTVAACEAALGLSLILALYQRSKSLDVDLWSTLREADLPAAALALDAAEPPVEQEPPQPPLPRLTPAGLPPTIDDDFPAEMAASVDARTIVTPSPTDDGEYR
ncbi:MAG: NADH-quinone oxidoreductase subunit NuoK [Planctomycetota bacterium]|nr:MAG: NADH-quinone oxidoreductase subunit NuoK [Planctomycetota bacterium]